MAAAAAVAALLVALGSGINDFPVTWDWLSSQRAEFAHLSPAERRQEPGTAQLLPVDAFDFFRSKLHDGDRYYIAAKRGGFDDRRRPCDREPHLRALLPAAGDPGRRARRRPTSCFTVGVDPKSLGVPLGRLSEVRRRQLLRGAGAELTGSLVGLLLANALYLVIGVALLLLLRIARTRDELYHRLGLAYILGLATTAGLAAHLALIGLPMAWGELVVLAAVLGVLGWRRFRDLRAAPRDAALRSAGRVERTLARHRRRRLPRCARPARARDARRSRCGPSSSGTAGRSGR